MAETKKPSSGRTPKKRVSKKKSGSSSAKSVKKRTVRIAKKRSTKHATNTPPLSSTVQSRYTATPPEGTKNASGRRKISIQELKKRICHTGFKIFAGVVGGIALSIGVFFILVVHNNPFLSQFIANPNELSETEHVRIEEEVDYSFINDVASETPEEFQDADFSEFWEVWRIIERDFVAQPERYKNGENREESENVPLESEKLTRKDLVEGATAGLTFATNDVYTSFLPMDDAEKFREEVLDGEIDGVIGAYIAIVDDELVILKAIKRSPAAQADLRSDDVIRTIDGVPSTRYSLAEASHAIRGKRGTLVNLNIYRPSADEEFDIAILRDKVDIPTVETDVRDDVFVIHLLNFTKQTPQAFRNALQEFSNKANSGGPNRLLLDMRGNSGGVLSSAMYIAGLFLPDRSVIFYEYNGTERLRVYRTNKSAFRGDIFPPMTILVDGGTASASEILAATLRHHGIADIVGTHTTGKGSVQTVKRVGDNAILKITTAHWLTPDKKPIGDGGIEPDVDYEKDLRAMLKEDADADIETYALDRAVEHLKSQ